MSERESHVYTSMSIIDGILEDWVNLALKYMNCGGDINDYEKGMKAGAKRMRWTHLNDHALVADRIVEALKLAGWTPPEGYVDVAYPWHLNRRPPAAEEDTNG